MPFILSFVVLSLRVLISGRCSLRRQQPCYISTLVIGSWWTWDWRPLPGTRAFSQYVDLSSTGDTHAGHLEDFQAWPMRKGPLHEVYIAHVHRAWGSDTMVRFFESCSMSATSGLTIPSTRHRILPQLEHLCPGVSRHLHMTDKWELPVIPIS